jgi:hypothetical protein
MSHYYRINGSMIEQFSGKPVSIIGTVTKVNEIISYEKKNSKKKFRFIHQAIVSIFKQVINRR